MTICHSTLCSLVVTAGLVAGAIDTADDKPGAVQVITVDTNGNTSAYLAALRPFIDLIHQYAPRAEIEVLERINGGSPTGAVYILVRHPDLEHLRSANQRMRTGSDWSAALTYLDLSGRTLMSADILIDRTPD
jgi:hypothetical protein